MRKNILQLLSVITLTIVSISVCHAAMVYKCKNAQGKLLYQKTPCTENAEAVSSWTPNTKVKVVAQEPKKKSTEVLIIRQGQGGHYFLNGEINSHTLTFVVDTGATTIALPRTIAASASLFCNDKVLMNTANGLSGGCTTTISELKLGNFVLTNVTAVIAPNLTEPLLGMNVLQLFNIEQKEGEMRLSDRDIKAP